MLLCHCHLCHNRAGRWLSRSECADHQGSVGSLDVNGAFVDDWELQRDRVSLGYFVYLGGGHLIRLMHVGACDLALEGLKEIGLEQVAAEQMEG